MAIIRGQLFFAPGILMKDLDFDDHESVLLSFKKRISGLFLAPIYTLRDDSNAEEGALFGAALLVAALIESIARVETGSKAQGTLIKQWLEVHLDTFKDTVEIGGARKTLAVIFEYRFRNGLAHSGYIASLGRLSRSIEGSVNVVGDVVTVNPFALAADVAAVFGEFAENLLADHQGLRRFASHVEQQFREEVDRAKAEAAA